MQELPATVDDLIDGLNASHPERCPNPDDSEREVWIAVGKRMVVRHLLRLREERDENRLGAVPHV